MADLIGTVLGDYTISALIGRGGMATVYKARQNSVARDVAIKVLSERNDPESPYLERFVREVQIIANLEHLHILPIYGYGEVDSFPYLVMRLLDGGSLNGRIRKRDLTLAEVERLIGQIASALDYAHARDVVHRDMKPHNVLLDRQGNAFICDFGIAKVLGAHGVTRTGEAIGTPTYMAPEQWQGLSITPATDVYALGVMLFEMLAGRPPFESENVFGLMYKHLNDVPAPLTNYRGDLPPAVDGVLFRALAKLPADRFNTAGELARAFVVALRPTSGGYRSSVLPASSQPTALAAETEIVHLEAEILPDANTILTATGRQWVIEAFQAWRSRRAESPVLFLTAPHGMGKSTLMRRFADMIGNRVIRHDLLAGQTRTLDPRACLDSLAWQLNTYLPTDQNSSTGNAFSDALADPFEILEARLLTPLQAAREPIYLLIDGLEAAYLHLGTNIADLVRYILENFPDQLRLIVSSAPDERVDALFRRASRIELQPNSEENRAELSATLSTRFATLMPHLSGGEVDLGALLEKSDGSPLYLTIVMDALAARTLRLEDLPDLPTGLEALFGYFIEKSGERALLYLLAAAAAPLTLATLSQVLRAAEGSLPAQIAKLSPLVTGTSSTGYQLSHSALRYYAAEDQPTLIQAHQTIAEGLYGAEPAEMSTYALENLPKHFLLAGNFDRCYELLTDLRFLTVRLMRVALPEILDDYAQLRLMMESSPDHEAALSSILEAVQAVVPHLSGDAAAVFGQLYNRLSGVPSLQDALTRAADLWRGPWLRVVFPLPQATNNTMLVTAVAAPIALAVGQAVGSAAGRLSALTDDHPSRSYFAACADGFLRLWLDGTLHREWIGRTNPTTGSIVALSSCAMTLDGRYAMSGSNDGAAAIWDMREKLQLASLEGHGRAVRGVALSGDASLALTAAEDRLLRLWEVPSGRLLQQFSEHPSLLTSCGFGLGKQGERVALSGAQDGVLRIFELAHGTLIAEVQAHRGAIICLYGGDAYLPIAITGGADGMICVWDTRSGEKSRNLVGATGAVTAVTIAKVAGNLWAAAASHEGAVRVWELESGALIAKYTTRSTPVSVGLTEDGTLVFGTLKHGLQQVQVLSGVRRPVEGHGAEVCGVAFTPDSARLLSGSLDREVRVWHADSGEVLQAMRGHSGAVHAVALRADGKVALSGGSDRTLRVWDVQRGTPGRILSGHGDTVTACAFSLKPMKVGKMLRAEALIASGSADRTIRIWDWQGGETLLNLKGHRDAITFLAFTEDEILVSYGRDRTLRLWSLAEGSLLKVLEDSITPYTAVAVSSDGRTILVGTKSGALATYDRPSDTLEALLPNTDAPITACGYSVDGTLCFAADANRLLRLIEVRQQRILATYRAPHAITCAAIAPNQVCIALGDSKGVVSVLRLEGITGPQRRRSLL